MCPQGAFSGCSSRQGDQSFWVPGAEGLLGTPDVQWQNQDCPEQIRMVGHPQTVPSGLLRDWGACGRDGHDWSSLALPQLVSLA